MLISRSWVSPLKWMIVVDRKCNDNNSNNKDEIKKKSHDIILIESDGLKMIARNIIKC